MGRGDKRYPEICRPPISASHSSIWPRDSKHRVKPIKTGIGPVDKMGVMEIYWYNLQLDRIGRGGDPRPDESGLWAFLKSAARSGWGTFRTQRARPNSRAA
jgi:hypothetical protein